MNNLSTIESFQIVVSILYVLFLIAPVSKLLKFKSVKRTKINKCKDGLVEVYGKCSPTSKLLTSPYSKKHNCIYYDLRVYTLREDSHDGHYWVRLYTKTKGNNFKLKDDSGEIEVDIGNAEYDLTDIIEEKFNNQSKIQRLASHLFEKEEKLKDDMLQEYEIRIEEVRLCNKDNVYVVGRKKGDILSNVIISDRNKTERINRLYRDMLIYTGMYVFIIIFPLWA